MLRTPIEVTSKIIMGNKTKQFLLQDSIDEHKFIANYQIIKSGTKEIYQAMIGLSSEVDISNDATPTIHWMALVYNQPLGYPYWFIAAYPDVVKWISNLEDKNVIDIVGNLTESDMDDKNYFNVLILGKIVDFYKSKNSLECQ